MILWRTAVFKHSYSGTIDTVSRLTFARIPTCRPDMISQFGGNRGWILGYQLLTDRIARWQVLNILSFPTRHRSPDYQLVRAKQRV